MINPQPSSSTDEEFFLTACRTLERDRRKSHSYWAENSLTTPVVDPHQRPALVCFASAPTTNIFASALEQLALVADSRAQTALSTANRVVAAALSIAYKLETEKLSRDAAKQLMRFVESNAQSHEWFATNKLLADVDTARLSSKALTGLIRATARTQEALPAWKKTYRRAWDAIEEKGKSPQAMFVGMENPSAGESVDSPT
ncbi:hypothetical protein [Variovorax sp. PAMC 28711]|uniref:hypothetical protein n=1 Tax=Variovorax sp. PAMC 28711 TaxID=1795631 RepID=UPI0012E7F0EC|nr:hypothetical protein [Variovorax sp. PAMC 28711]